MRRLRIHVLSMILFVCLIMMNTSFPVLAEEIAYSSADALPVLKASSTFDVKVTGKACYAMAYEVFNRINKERIAVGVKPLVIDDGLMEAAMQRAAECSVYYDHTRPNGSTCFSAASGKMYGENIAIGYGSVNDVMTGWMTSQGHKDNILAARYDCVGVGVFCINGQYSWVQCFGMGGGSHNVTKSDQTKQYTVNAASDKVKPQAVQSSMTIKGREQKNLQIKVVNQIFSYFQIPIDGVSYDWKSSNTNVVTVNSKGQITGKNAGTATVTAKNKTNSSIVTTFTITVNISFADVSKDSWQYSYVKYVYDNGLMTGKGSNKNGDIIFAPNDSITRAEVVQVLYSKEGSPKVTYQNKFKDVPKGKWYTNAIIWASSKGIVAGKGEKFDVNSPITRQEMASILRKYAQYKKYKVNTTRNLDSYKDANQINDWALPGMQWAVTNNIINGKDNRLDPLGKTTRAEAAAMLKNFIETYATK